MVPGSGWSYGPLVCRAGALLLAAPPARAHAQSLPWFDPLGGVALPASQRTTNDVALADVDGDGDLDLVAGNARAQNRLYLGDGRGRFRDVTDMALPAVVDDTFAIAVGDVDGDGDPDLVFGNCGSPGSRLLSNDGRGRFQNVPAARFPGGPGCTMSIALGDVDGDGDLDAVLGECGSSGGLQNRLLVNDGSGRFVDATVGRLPAVVDATAALGLADVDADGDLDLALANGCDVFYPEDDRLYLNDGRGVFSDVTGSHLPRFSELSLDVEFVDVDRDGALDLVFATYGSGSPRHLLYRNDGTGRFRAAPTAAMPRKTAASAGVAASDVDGDGDLDLVFANPNTLPSGSNSLYVNDGAGNFIDASGRLSQGPTGFALDIEAGDVDGDGDPDLAFAFGVRRGLGGQNVVAFNLTRQLHAARAPRIG